MSRNLHFSRRVFQMHFVETVMSRQLDDLEPTLARHGYRLKDMTEQFDAKAAEIRERMLAAACPI